MCVIDAETLRPAVEVRGQLVESRFPPAAVWVLEMIDSGCQAWRQTPLLN